MSTQSFRVPQPSTVPFIPILVGSEAAGSEELFDELKGTYQSIARRAYELHESRRPKEGHGIGDWLRAESELLIPVRAVVEDSEQQLTVRVLVLTGNDDDVMVHVEQDRIIIHSPDVPKTNGSGHGHHPDQLLHVIDLPALVDPESSRVMLDDGLLEVRLLKFPTFQA